MALPGQASVGPTRIQLKQTIMAWLRLLGLLPFAQKMRLLARAAAPKVLIDNFRFCRGGNEEALPIPGIWARLLVAGSVDIRGFLEAGRHGFECIRDTLARNGTPIESLENVLDFGCGCGRVTRHWHGLSNTRVHGTDINPYLVAACRRCLPFATIGSNSMDAKLDYADQSFDLIYAFSVFTHMDVAAQKAWRDELRRVLKPRGILLLSVHGEAYKWRLAGTAREDFDAGRPVVWFERYPGGNICVAFHPRSSVYETLAEGFEIVDAVPEGAKGNPVQDLYMLRKIP